MAKQKQQQIKLQHDVKVRNGYVGAVRWVEQESGWQAMVKQTGGSWVPMGSTFGFKKAEPASIIDFAEKRIEATFLIGDAMRAKR